MLLPNPAKFSDETRMKGQVNNMETSLGKRIQAARKRLGMTQEQLAEKLGVSGQAVSKWESDISCPDITALPVLADIFGMSVDELLRGKEKQTEAMELIQNTGKSVEEMFLRMYVITTEKEDGEEVKVKVSIPMPVLRALLDSGMDMKQIVSMQGAGDAIKGANIDFDSIIRLIDAGFCGSLMDVEVEAEDADVSVRIVLE